MNFEILSYIFAITLSLSAVFSPIITAKINNKHQLEINKQNNDFQIKLKNLELYFPAKNQALDNYLECLSKYLITQNNTNLYNYKIALAKANIYVSKDVMLTMDDIDDCIRRKDFQKVSELISCELSSALYKESTTKII